MVSSVTLDQTCIRALEKNSRVAPYVRALIDLYEARKINLWIAAPGIGLTRVPKRWQERLARLGLGDAEILSEPLLGRQPDAAQACIYYVTVSPKSQNKLKQVSAMGLQIGQVLSPQEAILCLY